MRLVFARTYTRALTLACLMSEGASVHCFTLSKLNPMEDSCQCQRVLWVWKR